MISAPSLIKSTVIPSSPAAFLLGVQSIQLRKTVPNLTQRAFRELRVQLSDNRGQKYILFGSCSKRREIVVCRSTRRDATLPWVSAFFRSIHRSNSVIRNSLYTSCSMRLKVIIWEISAFVSFVYERVIVRVAIWSRWDFGLPILFNAQCSSYPVATKSTSFPTTGSSLSAGWTTLL